MGESLKEFSLREAEATMGAMFREQVQRMKAQRAFFEELERDHPTLAKLTEDFEQSRQHEEEQTQSLKFMRQGPPFMIPDPTRRTFFQERLRGGRIDLQFNGGGGFGALSTFPPVADVWSGAVGWQRPVWIENRNDGEVFSNLHLGWSIDIPQDGSYIFGTSLPGVEVGVASQVNGSGLWGLDAVVTVVYNAFVSLSGTGALATERYGVLQETAFGWFGSSRLGDETSWLYPLPMEVPFVAQRGQQVGLAVNLMVWTWSNENGSAYFSVRKFYCPSNNPNSEVHIILT